MGFFCKFSRENQSLLIQQIVTALPFAVRMSVAVAVTSPELVLAVEVCKDPGQKDSVLMHKVGEHVKKCQEYEAGLSDPFCMEESTLQNTCQDYISASEHWKV